MSELPEGWAAGTLADIAKWGSGGTPSRKNATYYKGDIPWIKTGDLGDRIIHQTTEYITSDAVKNSSAKFFLKGSVAIAMYGATIGKTSILGIDATTNQACGVGYPIEGLTTTDYLYYLLKNEKENFISKGKGGAQPNISQMIIKSHEILLPPQNEQIRIANKLDSLLGKLEATQKHLDKIPTLLKRFRQSVLAAAISGELTAEWRTNNNLLNEWDDCLIDECGSVSGGLTKNPKRKEYELQYPYLRVANVYANELRLEEIHNIGVKESEIKRTLLKINDILIVEGNGSIEQIGRVALWTGVIENCLHQNHLIKFRSNHEKVLPKYVLYWLMSPIGRKYIVQVASSTAGLHTLSLTKVKNIKIRVPPIKEQKQIVRQVESLFNLADKVEQQYQAAKQHTDKLTQSILAKAFRGELVSQDSSDEPASELLKRIQLNKA